MPHATTTRAAWSQWLAAAGAPDLTALRHFEFEHVCLQLQAAVDGLGVALASMPLIESDIAAGRLVCPIAAPECRAEDYTLVVRKDRADNAPVRAFGNWITAAARGCSAAG